MSKDTKSQDQTTDVLNSGPLMDLVRQKMQRKGYSQKKLAAILDKEESTVSVWLAGHQSPRANDKDTVRRLASFLGKTSAQVRDLLMRQKSQARSISMRTGGPPVLDTSRRLLNILHSSLQLGYGQGIERLSNPIDSDSLGSVLRAEIGKDKAVRSLVEEVTRRLDLAWGVAGDDMLDSELLESVVAEVSGYRGCLKDNLVKILETQLRRLGLLKEGADGKIRRPWPLSSSYVMNSLFGLPIDIRNIDWLLDGGLVLPSETSGLVMLIKGTPGTGKTMFALQTAASIAMVGHIVVYLTVEQRPELLVAQLDYAGYKLSGRYTMSRESKSSDFVSLRNLAHSDAESTMLAALENRKGVVILASAPSRKDFEPLRNRLSRMLEGMADTGNQRAIYLCCVVDSIDAVIHTHQREVYRELFNFVRETCDVGMFISEGCEQGEELLREHMVDMSIRMGYRNDPAGFKARVLEIEKCRTQSFIRGEHRFAIHRGRGISVYPSVQSLLSVWRRRSRREANFVPEPWAIDDFDVSAILRGDVVNGSAVLVSGPAATHKLLLGLSFLASGLKANPNSNQLLISLREEPTQIARIIAQHSQLHSLLAQGGDSSSISHRLKVHYVPPDYFTADRFLDWIREKLAEFKLKQEPISRVVFNSLNHLFYSSPVCKMEPLLTPALIQLFKKQNITSLFIAIDSKRDNDDQNMFDTIIFTSHEKDSDQILLTVGYSVPGNADRGSYRLDRIQAGESAKLVLAKPKRHS